MTQIPCPWSLIILDLAKWNYIYYFTVCVSRLGSEQILYLRGWCCACRWMGLFLWGWRLHILRLACAFLVLPLVFFSSSLRDVLLMMADFSSSPSKKTYLTWGGKGFNSKIGFALIKVLGSSILFSYFYDIINLIKFICFFPPFLGVY